MVRVRSGAMSQHCRYVPMLPRAGNFQRFSKSIKEKKRAPVECRLQSLNGIRRQLG